MNRPRTVPVKIPKRRMYEDYTQVAQRHRSYRGNNGIRGGGKKSPKGSSKGSSKFNPNELIDRAESMPTQVTDLKRKLSSLGKASARVLLYSDLHKYKSLEQLLGDEGAIILVRQTPTFGHWVAVTPGPLKGMISYFDSYGYGIDDLLNEVEPEVAVEVGQTQPLLSNLINDAVHRGTIKDIDVNKLELQHPSSSVAVCGGYAVLRILWNKLTNAEFSDLLSDPAGSGSIYDRNVALLTSLL